MENKRIFLAFLAKAGSGKDTASQYFVDKYNFLSMSFALPLKEFCKKIFDFSDTQLFGPSEFRNAVDPRWGFAPREALQKLGDDWARSLNKNTWVEYLVRAANEPPFQGRNIVISDCRYLNEVEKIKEIGFVVKLIRFDEGVGTEKWKQHKSETEMDEIPLEKYTKVLKVAEGKSNFEKQLENLAKEFGLANRI